MDQAILGTAAAFGLASAAGLNTTLPLLMVGVTARLGLLSLAAPYDVLSSDLVLVGLAVLALMEIAGDKIPGADSVIQAIQWPLTLGAGAILFGTQQSIISEVSPGLAFLVGLLTAGSIHGLRSLVRPAVNLGTVGLGGPIVSALEDFASVGLTITSLFMPLLALLMLAVIVGVGIKLIEARRVRQAGTS